MSEGVGWVRKNPVDLHYVSRQVAKTSLLKWDNLSTTKEMAPVPRQRKLRRRKGILEIGKQCSPKWVAAEKVSNWKQWKRPNPNQSWTMTHPYFLINWTGSTVEPSVRIARIRYSRPVLRLILINSIREWQIKSNIIKKIASRKRRKLAKETRMARKSIWCRLGIIRVMRIYSWNDQRAAG